MKFRHIEDKSDFIPGYRYLLAFKEEDGTVFVDQDRTYSCIRFDVIDPRDGMVSVEDNDLDYVGFAYLESYRESEFVADGALKFIWKKVTNAVAYAVVPVILHDEDYEEDNG